MANSFSSPPTLPDQSLVLPGKKLLAQTFDAITDTFNWSHAEGPTSPVLSQEWAAGQCSWSGGSPATNVAIWRIPQVTPAHETLRVEFLASRSDAGGAGTSLITLSCNGDSVDTNPDVGAYSRYSIDLDFGQPLLGYADLALDLASSTGSVTLRGITAYFVPLTSALDAGPAGGVLGAYEPMGQSAVAADQSLTSVRGRRVIHNTTVLRDYPRMLFCWSALGGIQSWGPAAGAADQMAEVPHRSVVRVYPRFLAAGGVYTVWVLVLPDSVATTRVLIHAGGIASPHPAGWGIPVAEIEVAAVGVPATTWVSATFQIPETRLIGDLTWMTAAIGAWPGEPRADATILSMSIWGA